jgi:hypothetical protein
MVPCAPDQIAAGGVTPAQLKHVRSRDAPWVGRHASSRDHANSHWSNARLVLARMRNQTLKQNEQRLHEGSRWVLYHGTSTARPKRILEDGRLRASGTDDPKISLTTERSVAEYWAFHAVFGDRHDRPDEDSSEVVLVLDGEGLLELQYDLVQRSDLGRGGMRLGERDRVLGRYRALGGGANGSGTRPTRAVPGSG